jgi:hypothetical protein
MAGQFDLSKLSIGQFAERFRGEMIPLSNTFSYFCASVPMTEEDLKEYLREPVGALPPSIITQLPKISILLVPYLEKSNGRGKAAEFISHKKPPGNKGSLSSQVRLGDEVVMAFALKDQEIAEYHYRFYRRIATVLAERQPEEIQRRYAQQLIEELNANAHGEVDEASWRLKTVLRRRKGPVKDSEAFREYARESFIDTLTLYLHGICCDIDVETGPRQLSSKWLRKRLELLKSLYPPPKGYGVFPEDLKHEGF